MRHTTMIFHMSSANGLACDLRFNASYSAESGERSAPLSLFAPSSRRVLALDLLNVAARDRRGNNR